MKSSITYGQLEPRYLDCKLSLFQSLIQLLSDFSSACSASGSLPSNLSFSEIRFFHQISLKGRLFGPSKVYSACAYLEIWFGFSAPGLLGRLTFQLASQAAHILNSMISDFVTIFPLYIQCPQFSNCTYLVGFLFAGFFVLITQILDQLHISPASLYFPGSFSFQPQWFRSWWQNSGEIMSFANWYHY